MSNQEFKLKPSLLYALLLVLFVFSSLVITLLLPAPGWVRWPLTLLLFCYGISLLRQYALLLAPDSVLELKKLDDTRWQITTRRAVYEGTLLGDSLVSQVVSVLRFSVEGRRSPINCIIWFLSLPDGEYRRMTVLVKHN